MTVSVSTGSTILLAAVRLPQCRLTAGVPLVTNGATRTPPKYARLHCRAFFLERSWVVLGMPSRPVRSVSYSRF